MASKVPVVKLSSGFTIPAIGLGTWLSKPGEVYQAVKDAIEVGYRHLDCAHIYQNQEEIGRALTEVFAAGKVKRSDIFVTSKVWNTYHSKGQCAEAVDIILKQLQLDYLDLLLIHWPTGYAEEKGFFPKVNETDTSMIYSDIDYTETWQAMEAAVQKGKIRSIGLSNFSSAQIKRVFDIAKIKPAMNQVECNPWFPQNKLMEFCKSHDIQLTAYGPLSNPGNIFRKEGDPVIMDEPLLKEIAKRHGKTTAQVLIHWAVQRGTIVIPKSVKRHRLEENFDVLGFELSQEDMAQIATLDKGPGGRIVKVERDVKHLHYPFHDEF